MIKERCLLKQKVLLQTFIVHKIENSVSSVSLEVNFHNLVLSVPDLISLAFRVNCLCIISVVLLAVCHCNLTSENIVVTCFKHIY
jgi:hypothetical protein